jgi:hypothetical protein
MFYIWLEPQFYKASNGTRPTLKFLLSRQESSKQVDVQNLSRCSITIFWAAARVSCWSPLGLSPGDLHAPNSFLFSSHHHFRVWILLRFNLSSNSVAVHQFVRPQLVSLIIHLQIGCILPYSFLCSSICRQGLAFLVRSTEHCWSITRGDIVLRLRDLERVVQKAD